MANSAGALEIQMFAGMARLQADMASAKSTVTEAVHDLEKVLGGLGVGFSAHLLLEKINSVIEGMDALKNSSEKTGASVEELSKLKFFAEISGSSIGAVDSALIKLSKAMSETSKEATPAQQALKFLGLSAKDAEGNLKDPSVLLGEISQKLIGFKDGAGKAAIATALMGKAGAEQLPMLKKMAEIGDIEAITTTEQAEAAEAYALKIARLNREKEKLWNTIASALLPTMDSLVTLMLKAAKGTDSMGATAKKLADDGWIEAWADAGAMGIARVIDIIKTLIGALGEIEAPFENLFRKAQAGYAAMGIMFGGGSAGEKVEALNALHAENEQIEAALKARYATGGFWSLKINTEMSDALKAGIAERKALRVAAANDEGSRHPPDLPNLNFNIIDTKAAARAAAKEAALAAADFKTYTGALGALEKQLGTLEHQTAVGQLSFQLYGQEVKLADGTSVHLQGSLEKLVESDKTRGTQYAKNLLLEASLVDKDKARIELMKSETEAIVAQNAALEAQRAIRVASSQTDRDSLDDMKFAIDLIGRTVIEQQQMNEVRKVDLKLRADLRAASAAADASDPTGDNAQVQASLERTRQILEEGAAAMKTAALGSVAVRVKAERDWATGAKEAFNTYVDDATNAALQAKNAITSGLKLMEDGLFTFLRHGTSGFKDFVSSVKDMLARLAAQQITVQIAGSISGSLGIGGGVGGATSGASGASSLLNIAGLGSKLSGFMGSSAPSWYTAGIADGSIVASGSALTGAAATGLEAAEVGGAIAGGGAAAASTGIMAGLASIGPVGWAGIAAMAILGSGALSGGGGPKDQEIFFNDAKRIGNNNITSQNPAYYAQASTFSDQLHTQYTDAQLASVKLPGKMSFGAGQDEMAALTQFEAATIAATAGLKSADQAAQDAAKATAELAAATNAGTDATVSDLAALNALAAANDASAKLALQRRGLEIGLMEAQGRSLDVLNAKRVDEMAALDESLRPLQQQIYAAQDLAGASSKAAEEQRIAGEALAATGAATLALAQQRHTLEITLMETQGRSLDALQAKRADELAALDATLRPLQLQIYAAQDLAGASTQAAEQQKAAADTITAASAASALAQTKIADDVSSAIGALQSGFQNEASTLTASAGKWHDAAASLRAYGDTLTAKGGGLSYGVASSQFEATALRARMGDEDAVSKLQSASEALRTASLATSGSQAAYLRDIGRIQSALGDTAAVADRQEANANTQREILTQQVEALIDIKTGVTSVADLLTGLQGQIDKLAVATAGGEKQSRRTADILDAAAHGALTIQTAAA